MRALFNEKRIGDTIGFSPCSSTHLGVICELQVKPFPGALVWVGNGDVLVIGQRQETFPERVVCVCVGEGGYEKGEREIHRVCSSSAAPSCSLAAQKPPKGHRKACIKQNSPHALLAVSPQQRDAALKEGKHIITEIEALLLTMTKRAHVTCALAVTLILSHHSLRAGPTPPKAPTWRAWMSKITTEAGPPRANGMLLTILESVAAVATSPSTSICSRRDSLRSRMAHQAGWLCADGLLEARSRIVQSLRPRRASPSQPVSQHARPLPALRCLC